MIYAVAVRVPPKDVRLSDALADRQGVSRKVYVVGMTEEAALSVALDDTMLMEIEDPTGTEMLRFQYTETIGIENQVAGSVNNYEQLVAFAKNRAEQLTNQQARQLSNALRD